MPLYTYQCGTCGITKDFLQKIAAPELKLCPACFHESLKKQITAANFQLKGSGFYATDSKHKP